LQKAGLYEKYEQEMIKGNMAGFAKLLESWVDSEINSTHTFVTEQGDVEDWAQGRHSKEKLAQSVKYYLDAIKEHIS